MAKQQWVIDTTHSSIEFSVKHLMIAKVKGLFHSFEAQVDADPSDLTTADIQLKIDLNSIDTRNEDRDGHVRSADFFDVENYPQLTFQSTEITKKREDEYNVTGNVTLHGVTRQETFTVTYEGASTDPWGNEKAGFSGEGVLKRSDYGLTYNAALETGGFLIGEDIKFSIDIEAAKQA